MTPTPKSQTTTTLTQAFQTNQSVHHITGNSKRSPARTRALMEYAFDLCQRFGKVFLSDDGTACALILYPHKKRFSLTSAWLDIKLIFRCIGPWRLRKALRRETLIAGIRPKIPMSYLWFIGTLPGQQGKGLGSKLLAEVVAHSSQQGLPIYLETSNAANIPWYEQRGFEVYATAAEEYPLWFLRCSGVVAQAVSGA